MFNYTKEKSILNWEQFTLIDAYQLRPPIQYLAGNLFEVPSLNVIYGAPGSLKSFLLADLSVCVASGNPWLPPNQNGTIQGLPVLQGAVIWIDFDNGKSRTHDRFKALGKALSLPSDAPLTYYSMPIPWFDATKINQIYELSELITNKKAKLVTIDNLGVISGGVDENSVAMIGVLSNLRLLVENTGIVLIVIHHRRKSNGQNGRQGDSLRGHSSIEAALDLALLIERQDKSETIKIMSTKNRGASVSPFSANFKYRHDGEGQLIEARFYSTPDEDLTTINRIKSIYESVSDDPINKSMLIEAAYKKLDGKVGKNRIGDNIDEMVNNGYLIKTHGLNNAQLFTRNPNRKP